MKINSNSHTTDVSKENFREVLTESELDKLRHSDTPLKEALECVEGGE
jgi:hypothetical protein